MKLMKFRQPDFKLKILGSYPDLIAHILSVIVQVLQVKHTIAAFEIMEDDSQNARVAYLGIGQQPVVKGLCAVTTIKTEGWKRSYVILTHSKNEDGDMFLLFLCALVIRVTKTSLEISSSPTGFIKHLWMYMSTQSLKVLQKYSQHLFGR